MTIYNMKYLFIIKAAIFRFSAWRARHRLLAVDPLEHQLFILSSDCPLRPRSGIYCHLSMSTSYLDVVVVVICLDITVLERRRPKPLDWGFPSPTVNRYSLRRLLFLRLITCFLSSAWGDSPGNDEHFDIQNGHILWLTMHGSSFDLTLDCADCNLV